TADQDDVLGPLGELGGGKQADLPAIDLGAIKLEPCEITMHGELGRVHLVADRAQTTISLLGGDQMAQQPFGLPGAAAGAVLQCLGIATGHAVQAQLLEVGNQVRHASAPRAGCRSGWCRWSVARSPSAMC